MDTGHIRLWWKLLHSVDSLSIYHDTKPFFKTNLPSPLVTNISPVVQEFIHHYQDTTVDHYYRIVAIKNSKILISTGFKVERKIAPKDIIICAGATDIIYLDNIT